MKKLGFLFLLILLSLGGLPQEIAPGVFWVYFNDKSGNGFEISEPGLFLSERSINRRAMQGLGVDRHDLPVTASYLQEIRDLGVEIKHVSRWLNGIAMTGMNESLFQQVLALSFTDTIPWEPETDDLYFPPKSGVPRFDGPLEPAPTYDYGSRSCRSGPMACTNWDTRARVYGSGCWMQDSLTWTACPPLAGSTRKSESWVRGIM